MTAVNKNDSNKKDPSASMDDVVRPGKTPVSSTSRPIIVGHKMVTKQDPMVASVGEPEEANDDKNEPQHIASSGGRVIEPLASTSGEAKEEVENKPADDSSDPQKEKESNNNDESLGSSSAAVDALASEVSAKREAEKASEADIKKLAELEEVIASRKYFVPIGEVSKRRMNHIIIGTLFFVLLLLAGINFGMDAELLDTGLQPLTNLL